MRRLLLLSLLSAVLAGCGSPAPVREPSGVLDLVATDFRYAPQNVTVPAGKVTFRVRDAGRVPHNVSLRNRGGSERVVVSTLLPGESDQATITLKPGRYRFFCAIANHEELGQYGTLVVR